MDLNTILLIVSGGLAVVAAVAGGFLGKAKGKLKQLVELLKQTWELVDAVFKALEDNTITPEEVEVLKKEAKDVKNAFLDLIGKTVA